MKKEQDLTAIISIALLILFSIFTIIYLFNTNNINDNSNFQDNNVNSSIYHEHIEETNNIASVTKTYEEISTYTTNIYDDDKNRMHNITIGCETLDGHIIEPNTEFSFNDTIGEISKSTGYKKSTGFDSNGNKIKVYGGGICQISSTLYNAVLLANLEVTERHAHSRRVYYVPKDKDATVFSGGPDLKFKNNSDANIMICTHTDGNTVTVILKQEKIVENK